MSLIELMAFFGGIICIFIISYGLFLMKPYSEPIVTEGKIVEKYTLPEVISHTGFSGGSMPLITGEVFYIVVLSNKGYKIKIRVGTEYDTFEIDDPVEITEYSRIKRTVEKKRDLHPRNEEINS